MTTLHPNYQHKQLTTEDVGASKYKRLIYKKLSSNRLLGIRFYYHENKSCVFLPLVENTNEHKHLYTTEEKHEIKSIIQELVRDNASKLIFCTQKNYWQEFLGLDLAEEIFKSLHFVRIHPEQCRSLKTAGAVDIIVDGWYFGDGSKVIQETLTREKKFTKAYKSYIDMDYRFNFKEKIVEGNKKLFVEYAKEQASIEFSCQHEICVLKTGDSEQEFCFKDPFYTENFTEMMSCFEKSLRLHWIYHPPKVYFDKIITSIITHLSSSKLAEISQIIYNQLSGRFENAEIEKAAAKQFKLGGNFAIDKEGCTLFELCQTIFTINWNNPQNVIATFSMNEYNDAKMTFETMVRESVEQSLEKGMALFEKTLKKKGLLIDEYTNDQKNSFHCNHTL
jgi:hypothetical protein